MTKPRFIEIDGRHYLWRDILELRRARTSAHGATCQPALPQVWHDCAPATCGQPASAILKPRCWMNNAVTTAPPTPALNSIGQQSKERNVDEQFFQSQSHQ